MPDVEELPVQFRRHLAWLQYPIEHWPEAVLDALDDDQLREAYLMIEQRIAQSNVLLREWGIPMVRLTPNIDEYLNSAHPLERAWWLLHHHWMCVIQALPFEDAVSFANTHNGRADKWRREIVKQFKDAERKLAAI